MSTSPFTNSKCECVRVLVCWWPFRNADCIWEGSMETPCAYCL